MKTSATYMLQNQFALSVMAYVILYYKHFWLLEWKLLPVVFWYVVHVQRSAVESTLYDKFLFKFLY